MNVFLLYALLLKATLTSFSGLASLPMVRNDLVVERKVLTDRELNTAVVAGRTSPGPNGLYLVSVGYYAARISRRNRGTVGAHDASLSHRSNDALDRPAAPNRRA